MPRQRAPSRPRSSKGSSCSRSTAARATRSRPPAPTGSIGPDLDLLLGGAAEEPGHGERERDDRVYSAIIQGVGGRMPKGILEGAQAKAVAQFVADNVQYIPGS